MKEGDIVRASLAWLKLHGVFCWRNNTGAFAGEYKGKKRFVRFGYPGVSDIIGIGPAGKLVAVECKTPKGRVTPDQERFLQMVDAMGGIAFVVRSIDDLEKRVEAFR